jgi:hypothetical protein
VAAGAVMAKAATTVEMITRFTLVSIVVDGTSNRPKDNPAGLPSYC